MWHETSPSYQVRQRGRLASLVPGCFMSRSWLLVTGGATQAVSSDFGTGTRSRVRDPAVRRTRVYLSISPPNLEVMGHSEHASTRA